MTTNDERQLRRQFRKIDLSWEEQVFLRILATLGLSAWALIIYARTFPMQVKPPAHADAVQVARVLLKPPPPPVEKKAEPEPLPPRKQEEKPGPAPASKVAKAPPPGVKTAKAEPAKRSVATMGLLSMLSSAKPRADSSSQRVGEVLRNVDFRQAKDLTEDVGSLTGSVGAREKVSVGDMVAGLPRGTGTQVVLEGKVVSPITGPAAPTVSGAGGGVSGRTIQEVRQVIASYVPGLKYLYDRELKQRPSLQGKVTVEFVISSPGDVIEIRLVSSGLRHPTLESAILGRIRGWKFPNKPGDSTRVTFPFDFVAPAG